MRIEQGHKTQCQCGIAPSTGVYLYLHAWTFQHFLKILSSSLPSLSLLPSDAAPVLLIVKNTCMAIQYTKGNLQVMKLIIKYCNIVGTHLRSLCHHSQWSLVHPSPAGRWLSGGCLRLNGWNTRVTSVNLMSFHNMLQKSTTNFPQFVSCYVYHFPHTILGWTLGGTDLFKKIIQLPFKTWKHIHQTKIKIEMKMEVRG